MLPEVITRFHANYQSPTRALGCIIVGALLIQCVATHPPKRNWLNPCTYNRTSRDIKTLEGQVDIAQNEYRKVLKKSIKKMYVNYPAIPCDFLVDRRNDMLRSYAKFYVLGVTIEKVLSKQVKSSDFGFPFDERRNILTMIRNRINSVMCEMYDVLHRRKRFKKKIRNERKLFSTNLATNMKNVDLTNVSSIDNCLYSTYKRLIFSLNRRLKKRRSNLPLRKSRHNKL